MKGERALIIKECNRQFSTDIVNTEFNFIKSLYLRHAVRGTFLRKYGGLSLISGSTKGNCSRRLKLCVF